MDFVITGEQLLEYLKAISVIGAAVAVIYKMLKPLRDVKDKANDNEKAIAETKQIHEHDINELKADIQELKEMSKLQCKCSFAIISHELTGNSIDKLKDTKEELEKHLIEK